jgi:hypothetical protein
MDIERLTRSYIKMRDTLAEKRRAYEEEERDIKTKMTRLETAMLQHLQETNVESVRTTAGTVYRTLEVTPSGSDWDAFYTWIAENNAFEALERRIKRTFIKEYMDTNDGALPPGVSVYKEYAARVRRPS